MTTHAETVRDHYQAAIANRDALLARIAAAVAAMEPPIDARRLAPIDQFHVGGLAATIAFAERVGVTPDQRVLDAGSGLGGPARYLAETFGCHVEGIDLAPDYVALATMLTGHAGLADRVTFREGDLTGLPFANGAFDLVWTQHVAMNIADRAGLYRELRRVLAAGGRLAFYDPIAADGHPELVYPVPWAETAATSTLLAAAEMRGVLEASGFTVTRFDDVTAEAMGWAQAQGSAPAPGEPNVAMIVGARMAGMAANFVRNLREGRARLMMGVAEVFGVMPITLVTGATGKTGGYDVPLLIERGHTVRAFVHRQDERADRLGSRGAEVAEGDLLDLAAVRRAMDGVRGAYFCYPIAPGLVEASAYFAQAARAAGVGAIVNISQISARADAGSDAARQHWISERGFD